MSESLLSFTASESFRKKLLTRNLPPYNVEGSYSPTEPVVNYETNLTVSNVVDSPNNLVSTNLYANNLYPLNEFGPEDGFGNPITVNLTPILDPNQGPYYPNVINNLEIINELYIDFAYLKNTWVPEGGYKDLIIVTDFQLPNQYFSPYTSSGFWNFSLYSTFNILFQNDPVGSNGLLSQDSSLMRLGAMTLKELFKVRVEQEILQSTLGVFNLGTISDPFSASLLATGQQPFFLKNWKITVPENPILAAVTLANRLSGTYFPVSFIPGDYFDEVNPYTNPTQTSNALNVVNNLTGGLLSPILNKTRNPSEIFVANTGGGTRSTLFATLDYNKYRPSYNIGIVQGISQILGNLVSQNTPASGGYYVGSQTSEPSLISSPPNQVPVNEFGQQEAAIVYGPQELGVLFEGNIGNLNFGLAGKSYTNDGGIAGQFVWTSPKYNPNAGWKVGVGSDRKFIDEEFNQIQSDYDRYRSTNIDFKLGSILDKTQRLVDSADQVQGQTRLKHVGNAINQISKVFNDGYKEITKGSKVLSYSDQTTGQDSGIEYCRLFQKDTPYFTYADLQKTDGITNSGRKFTYSVFDNTYNLNIVPFRNQGSTNIVNGKVKKYMFSIENLAWRTSDRAGYTYDDLPVCEKGPNGGRIMWFPPYDIKFSDDSKPFFNETSFIGRPEPIYTYKNTSRSGSLSWTIIVDNPSIMNAIVEKQLENIPKERIDSIVDSFYAGCTKYDIYELATKFSTISPKDLYIYQQVLNNPRITTEEYVQTLQNIPINELVNKENSATNGDKNPKIVSDIEVIDAPLNDQKFENYVGYGFYFHNDLPDPRTTLTVATQPFDVWYDQYLNLKNTDYQTKAPEKVFVGNDEFEKSAIPQMFTKVVEGNFSKIKTLLSMIDDVIVKRKGTITITLTGSASAPNTEEYNVNLSKRRISSVIKWFETQKTTDNKTFGQYITEQKLIFIEEEEGEVISIIKQSEGDPDINPEDAESNISSSVNCNVDIKQLVNGKQATTLYAQRYSVPAMACRRVVLKNIESSIVLDENIILIKPVDDKIIDVKPDKEEINDVGGPFDVSIPTTGLSRNIKPQAELSIEQKFKEGISKKLLRNLFSECDYFDVVKESNPMIYDSIKEKIKYFNPAFHSMTPEGLNSRLTFLNQCVRPGQTIPIIGPDGRPKYNDALNTAFGAPPILVLRIGDFYHCKIVPNNLGITYEPLIFDINPEGIGIQPMIAKISLGFSIIGGMGLKEPVQELQNALSFNFYANTEIYDERATSTDKESTEKNDKYIIEELNLTIPPISSTIVNTPIPKKGQSAIGDIIGENSLDYKKLIDELQSNATLYIDSYFNFMKQIEEQNNFGILQMVNKQVNYSDGKLSEYVTPTDFKIYGKPNNVELLIDTLIERVKNDVNDRKDPIMVSLIADGANYKNKTLREVEDKLKKIVQEQNGVIANSVNLTINDFVITQEILNFTIRKLDVVVNKLDGLLIDTNNPIIYDLSGDTFFSDINTEGSIINLYLNNKTPEGGVSSFYKRLEEFTKLMDSKINVPKQFDGENSTLNVNNILGHFGSLKFLNEEDDRFYLTMSQIFTNDTKKQKLIEDLTNGTEVKKEEKIITAIKETINTISIRYNDYYKEEKKLFSQIETMSEFVTIKSYILPSINNIVTYTTPSTIDVEIKTKKIKDLYANQNLNDNKTFNGKVTFN